MKLRSMGPVGVVLIALFAGVGCGDQALLRDGAVRFGGARRQPRGGFRRGRRRLYRGDRAGGDRDANVSEEASIRAGGRDANVGEEASIRAGGVDWIAVWRAMQAEVAASRGEDERPPPEDRWAHRAERFGADDPVAFLRAMTAAARRYCVLHLGLRAPGSALDPLRRRLRGTPSPRRPAALEALNVLHQLGLPASLSVIAGSERSLEVGSDEEDLTELCHRLSLDPSEASCRRLRGLLIEFAPANGEGKHVLGVTGPNTIVGWPVVVGWPVGVPSDG